MDKLTKAKLLFNTVKHLKPVQIYGRVWKKIYKPIPRPGIALTKRTRTGQPPQPCRRSESLIGENTFRFLHFEAPVICAQDWNDKERSHLWRYNLHYFDLLRSSISNETGTHWINRWINENPPGTSSGWDPYTSALRITNWIYWDLLGNALNVAALESLSCQVWFLRRGIETHFQANHLFVDYKALYLAGCFFETPNIDKLRKFAARGLIEEIRKQFGEDGGHFELSPMYHGIMVEDLIDVLAIQTAYSSVLEEQTDQKLNKLIRDRLPRMLGWLIETTHPDGTYVLFNDAANGIASTTSAILDFAFRCGIQSHQPKEPLAYQRNTGNIKVTFQDIALFVDVGEVGASYNPAHAHADSLTFECSIFGKRFIVDTGTSEYAEGPTREFQRSTAAHNTVEVDDTNSSEVWSAFRVARRANPGDVRVIERGDEIQISASHNGYKKIIGGPIHERKWMISENKLAITDSLRGPFKTAVSRFHLHPDVKIEIIDELNITLTIDNRKVNFKCEGGKIDVLPAYYSPEFGLKIKNSVIVVRFESEQIEQTFSW